jgi:hypothetical protein
MARILVAAASAALLLGASLASAETLTGRVVSKDEAAKTLTIQTDTGEQVVFQAGAAAIRAEGVDVGLDRVQIGDRVRVQTDDTATRTGTERAAASVEVMTAAAAAPATGEEAAEMPGTEPGMEQPGAAPMEGTAGTQETTREERFARLPDTAGPVPALGLAGFAALLAGLALRLARR